MHTIHVFVLRLFVDSEHPHCLRGALRSVPDGQMQPFADEQALLVLLRQVTGHASFEPEPAEASQDQERKMTP